MTQNEFSINFSGLTHDHTILDDNNRSAGQDSAGPCSTIAILRRHPMYDCLVLVKKFRSCLNGYSLEFPTEIPDKSDEDSLTSNDQNLEGLRNCGRRKLISRFLDGDDPMYQSSCIQGDSINNPVDPNQHSGNQPFATQLDDRGDKCELVHVPINGLLDRLKNYTSSEIAVDSRVYAFAMGLKTAERILTTGCMKELQETPI